MPHRIILYIGDGVGTAYWTAARFAADSLAVERTPASFAAHVISRASEFEIARQMADARVDVLLGGGSRYFDRGLPARLARPAGPAPK